uniref:Restin homolog isoform X2 n=1 Tax=Crassostrea virginica TaxID=6565 RepID=A0A8B8DAV4_CRAVI|nr:restin homolog isoform X2 [Crassostrea virginica]
MESEVNKCIVAVKRYLQTIDKKYRDLESNLKKSAAKPKKGEIDICKLKEAFSLYEEYLSTKFFYPQLQKDTQYKATSKIFRSLKSPGPTETKLPTGNKTGSAGSRGSSGTPAETRPIKQPGGAQRILSSSEATQNATTDAKKKALKVTNTRKDSRQETTAEEDAEKDDPNKITQELRKNLLEKEEEIKEIREQLQTLAKDFGIQGDSHVEIISQISSNIKELETSLDDVKKAVFRETKVKDKEHDIEKTKERIQELHRNVRDLESSLDEIKKVILRKSEVADKDIEKIKERIEELHRQEQDLFDLKKAVLRPKDTKDEKQTFSTKDTLERVNALYRNVQELESSLDEVRKAILRESKVTDKDIEKTKERIEELHRQEQDLFDLKNAVLRPKDTKDEKQTFSTKETLERVNALHSQEQDLIDLKKAVLRPKDTKDEKQTFSTKETLERVNALHSKVEDLESNLKDVDKAVFGESVVKDKEHDIGKTKERIKELNRMLKDTVRTRDECSEWIKLAFDGELQKVASTKYLEQSQHTMENAKKLAQQLKRTADEYNNHIRKMEEEISDLEQKLRESATKQQKMQENGEKIERKLNDDLKKLQIEKERLLTRLSEVAGSKLTAGNPNITDLSDSNRPTKIAEQFSELYDNLWTDVFEKLCQNSKMSDIDAIRTLLQYLEKSYARCKEISTERYKILSQS